MQGVSTLVGLLGLGLLLGLKHATETDHVVAVSTFVSQTRSLKKSTMAGVLWGIGHTITLFIVGGIILLLKVNIPEKVAMGMELPVAIVLVVLGVRLITKARKQKIHLHTHEHQDNAHAHLHSHEHSTSHRHPHQSLWMGLLHGLAGSAALVLLVAGATPSPLQGLAFILVFGLGSVIGMLIVSTLIGLPLLLSTKFKKVDSAMQLAAGSLSVFVGALLIYELLIVEKILG